MNGSAFTTQFLIVDDNVTLVEIVESYLRERNAFCVGLTENPLAWLRQNTCEVLLIDLSMPGVDTAELIRTIRATHRELPIFIFSSLGHAREQMNAALRAGAHGYVSKNLPLEQLYCVLSRVLTGARTQARRLPPVPLGVA